MSTAMLHRAIYASACQRHEHDKTNLDLGTHVLIDGKGEFDVLNDADYLAVLMQEHLSKAGATVLNTMHRQFSPQGVTVLIMLAESHASIHTYPEHGTYMMDVFTCGTQIEPVAAAEAIAKAIGGDYSVNAVSRGG